MTLSQVRLSATLSQRSFRYFGSVESTNDVAIEWLRDGAESGAIVIADEQCKGRGRMKRNWQTPPGTAIAASIIMYPPPTQLHLMMMLGAVCVAELLDNLGVDSVSIKWPNDVQIAGKKVCGILPELAWEGNRLLGVVLGIGINVRVDFTGSELFETAISIETVLGRPIDRADLIADLLKRIDGWMQTIVLMPDKLITIWKSRLNMLNQSIRVSMADGTIVSGLAHDVDEDGALVLKTLNGDTQRILFGDVNT